MTEAARRLSSRSGGHGHPMCEAAQSPRLLIVRPQSSLSSTDSKLVSRDPPREKCDSPSPVAWFITHFFKKYDRASESNYRSPSMWL